jgi:hypothetical protein
MISDALKWLLIILGGVVYVWLCFGWFIQNAIRRRKRRVRKRDGAA